MKTKILLLFLFAASHLSGGAQRLFNESNNYLGTIDSNGKVFDASNRMNGKILNDGTIYNQYSCMVGRWTKEGALYDRNNCYIGKVEKGAVFKNDKGETLTITYLDDNWVIFNNKKLTQKQFNTMAQKRAAICK